MRMRNSGGFTLLELIVVIVILGMIAAVVVPRLRSTGDDDLPRSARSLAATIRYLNDKAITSGGQYRLKIVFAENGYKIVRILSDGTEEAPTDTFLKQTVLPDKVTIQDVLTERLGKVAEGEVGLTFGPGGLANFAAIHLKGSEKSMTVFAYPSTGKVKVAEGYLEQAE